MKGYYEAKEVPPLARGQIHFWYARSWCRESKKEDRKNQENGKCIRRRVGKSRNKRSERKFENFSFRARRSHCPLLLAAVYFRLITEEN